MTTSTFPHAAPDASVSKTRAPRSKNQPSKILPTNRISVPKQIEIARAYAASYESQKRAVTNADVGAIVGMTANTVSLVNAFFVSTGILERTEGGYIPSTKVMSFLRAHSWKPENAARKLSPLFRDTWFTNALMPKLRFRKMSEEEAITTLAEAAQAGPTYKTNLRMLLEYLETAGLILRDNGDIDLAPRADEHGEGADDVPEDRADDKQIDPSSTPAKLATPAVSSSGDGGAVAFSINVNVSMAELSGWTPDQLSSLFKGVALVLAARNGGELKEIEGQAG